MEPRTARHQTQAAARHNVDSSSLWDFQPQQHVMTCDQLAGTVMAVYDGPFPGSEEYEVSLDGGLGGGRYTASQLSEVAPVVASAGTAAYDYPELGQILTERPDPAHQQILASRNPTREDDEDEYPDQLSSLLTTAAADPDFRWHITASWSDVVHKAKRIRAEGGVRVTLATDGLVVGEIRGDHHVYETGLQRLPGRISAAHWSCGCKWGAYHWGADDDLSRFAGRMCSHALALQYEAQSRGMFGRDVTVDSEKPSWVPRHIVVKWDIDADRNELGRSSVKQPGGNLFAAAPLQLVVAATLAFGKPRHDVRLLLRDAGLNPRSALPPVIASYDAWEEDDEGNRFHRDEYGDPVFPCYNKYCYDGEHSDGETQRAHSDVYTDWDQVHPHLGSELHRGMAISLPAHVHEVVHDEHRPTAERAQALSDHLGGQGLGSHWTPNGEQARHYSGVSDSNHADTHVVLHAHTPDKEHIETDPDELHRQDVIAMGDHDDAEVPLSFGAPVHLKGVSWRKRTDRNWVRHDFDEAQHHTAAVSSPFGEPSGEHMSQPRMPGATTPRMVGENPASAGPLSGADPVGWDQKMPMGSLDDRLGVKALDSALFEPGGTMAMAQLNDDPEGALPVTDAGDGDGYSGGMEIPDDGEALSPTMGGLRKGAARDFTPAERRQLIQEGGGVGASNLDRLRIEGTHYEHLEELDAADPWWLS